MSALLTALMGRMKFTDGRLAVRPVPGPINVPSFREILGVAKPTDPAVLADITAVSKIVTWSYLDNVTEVTAVTRGASVTKSLIGGVIITFGINATDENLVQTEHLTDESFRVYVPYGVPRTFRFSSAIMAASMYTFNESEPDTSDVILEAN